MHVEYSNYFRCKYFAYVDVSCLHFDVSFVRTLIYKPMFACVTLYIECVVLHTVKQNNYFMIKHRILCF